VLRPRSVNASVHATVSPARRLHAPLEWWLRLLLVIVLLGLVLPSAEVFSQIGPGASLTVVRGSVSVTRPDGTAIYPAGTGLTLAIGDIVGTLERTRAIVTFFSGSEVELGSNTTIVIRRLDRDLLDSANVTVEHLTGLTVIRINNGQPVRIETADTVAVIYSGEAGHGADPVTNNVTAVCVDGTNRCGPNSVAFPTELAFLPGSVVRVVTGRGDLVEFRASAGDSVWDLIDEGGSVGTQEGTQGNQGNLTSRERNQDEDDKQPKPQSTTPTATPSPTPILTGTPPPSSTATPTVTLTPTPTQTVTPTAVPPTPTPPAGTTGPPCGQPVQPGGGQVTTIVHNVGRTSGTLRIDWNAFIAADRFQIFYEGAQVFDSGFVSDVGGADVPFVQVTVTGSVPISVWTYRLGCLP
jgi:hypothetical protein